jgi:hypothetical protein
MFLDGSRSLEQLLEAFPAAGSTCELPLDLLPTGPTEKLYGH